MLFHNKNTAFPASNHPTKKLYLSRRTQNSPLHHTRTASFDRLFIIKSSLTSPPFLFNLSPSAFTKATLLLPPTPFSPSFFTLHKKKEGVKTPQKQLQTAINLTVLKRQNKLINRLPHPLFK